MEVTLIYNIYKATIKYEHVIFYKHFRSKKDCMKYVDKELQKDCTSFVKISKIIVFTNVKYPIKIFIQ